jgi:hypothetical protein
MSERVAKSTIDVDLIKYDTVLSWTREASGNLVNSALSSLFDLREVRGGYAEPISARLCQPLPAVVSLMGSLSQPSP